MGADREYLRFNVPLEMDVPEDHQLFESFNLIPNGLKQEVVKMALLSILPDGSDEAEWTELLKKALLAQSKTGRSRGRKKRVDDDSRKPVKVAVPKPVEVAPQAVPGVVTRAVQIEVAVAQVQEEVKDVLPEVVALPELPEPVAPATPVPEAPKAGAEARLRYGGMIGGASWSRK